VAAKGQAEPALGNDRRDKPVPYEGSGRAKSRFRHPGAARRAGPGDNELRGLGRNLFFGYENWSFHFLF